jgi:hypothetical protein
MELNGKKKKKIKYGDTRENYRYPELNVPG